MHHHKLLFLVFLICVLAFCGCASTPVQQDMLPSYSIGGSQYYALSTLCGLRNISWTYDTFARTVELRSESTTVNLRVGDQLVLVNGKPAYFTAPVDIYLGTVVVPVSFKSSIIDVYFMQEPRPQEKVRVVSKLNRIIIDAGHGGNDPGAIGKTGLREKDVNLDIAKRVVTLLKSQGIDAVMTRSSDTFVPLPSRVEKANKSRSDLFVSIHSNANPSRNMNGFEIYYVATSVSDSQRGLAAARDSNTALDKSAFSGGSASTEAIVWDMVYTNSRAEAIELSRAICRSIDDDLGIKILGIKGARYHVLKGVQMPGVLVEVGFLSNAQEEIMLKDGFYRQKIAKAIADGIQRYAHGMPSMEVTIQ